MSKSTNGSSNTLTLNPMHIAGGKVDSFVWDFKRPHNLSNFLVQEEIRQYCWYSLGNMTLNLKTVNGFLVVMVSGGNVDESLLVKFVNSLLLRFKHFSDADNRISELNVGNEPQLSGNLDFLLGGAMVACNCTDKYYPNSKTELNIPIRPAYNLLKLFVDLPNGDSTLLEVTLNIDCPIDRGLFKKGVRLSESILKVLENSLVKLGIELITKDYKYTKSTKGTEGVGLFSVFSAKLMNTKYKGDRNKKRLVYISTPTFSRYLLTTMSSSKLRRIEWKRLKTSTKVRNIFKSILISRLDQSIVRGFPVSNRSSLLLGNTYSKIQLQINQSRAESPLDQLIIRVTNAALPYSLKHQIKWVNPYLTQVFKKLLMVGDKQNQLCSQLLVEDLISLYTGNNVPYLITSREDSRKEEIYYLSESVNKVLFWIADAPNSINGADVKRARVWNCKEQNKRKKIPSLWKLRTLIELDSKSSSREIL